MHAKTAQLAHMHRWAPWRVGSARQGSTTTMLFLQVDSVLAVRFLRVWNVHLVDSKSCEDKRVAMRVGLGQ